MDFISSMERTIKLVFDHKKSTLKSHNLAEQGVFYSIELVIWLEHIDFMELVFEDL